ncbi:hypothetical protein DL765_006763 [Monosporascus sp. GIB2]|nr:hypothetical protein DL765_006763 [Monosporascus sp. GIB2]
MSKSVVILGAGFTGLPLAHRLLKYTAPKPGIKLKVVLVTPSSKFYWNLAATRGVIPGAIPDDQLFLDIKSALSQYPSSHFELLLGRATAVDASVNTVRVALNNGSQQTVVYDHLVIATGSHIGSNLPYKLLGSYEETLEALHSLQDRIDEAKSIVVAGAGPTGVEAAGEIAAAYGTTKEVTLINSSEHVLHASNVLPSVAQSVERDLRKLGVNVISNTKVISTRDADPTENHGMSPRKTDLVRSNGKTIVVDCYLPLFGVVANTQFLPEQWLDKDGNLKQGKTMRVEGTTNVWGIGDVGNLEPKQVVNTDAQIIYLAETLDRILTGKHNTIKEYKPLDKTMIFISMGPRHATGQIGNWKLWSWMVNYVKGRSIFLDEGPDYVGGKKLRHAAM